MLEVLVKGGAMREAGRVAPAEPIPRLIFIFSNAVIKESS
jgi:hypothetical protein